MLELPLLKLPLLKLALLKLALLAVSAAAPAPLPQDPAAAPAAAEPARATLAGLVKQADGSAWVGARVQLLARPVGQAPELGPTDHVLVVADQRGQFRAEVRPGWLYTVWADSLATMPGFAPPSSCRVTATAEACVAGRPVELRERAAPLALAPIALQGREAWPETEPLRFRLYVQTDNVFVADVWLGEAGLQLPPHPVAPCDLVVFAGGVPVHTARVEEAATGLVLPPPTEQTLLVRSGFRGDPVPGATIYRRLGAHDHALGVTGADGTLRLRRAEGDRPWRLRVEAAGHRRGHPTDQTDAAGTAALVGDLQALPAPRQVRVVVGGEPLADLPIRIAMSAYRCTAPSGGSSYDDVLVRRTDADGCVTVASPDAVTLHAVLDAATLRRLAGAGHDLHPLVFLGDDVPAGTTTTYDLGDWRPVTLQLRTADGAPAVAADVLLTEARQRARDDHPHRVTDQRGELDLLLPQDRALGFVAVDHPQIGIGELAAGALQADTTRLLLATQRPFWLRGRIVDADGREVPKAGIFCTAKQDRRLPPRAADAADAADAGGPAAAPPPAGTVRLQEVAAVERMSRLLSLLHWHKERYRGSGPEFEFALAPVPWRYFVNAYAGDLGKQLDVDVVGDDEPIVIELEAQRR